MKILEISKEFRLMLTPVGQFMAVPRIKHFTRYAFGLIVAEKKKKRFKESMQCMQQKKIAAIRAVL